MTTTRHFARRLLRAEPQADVAYVDVIAELLRAPYVWWLFAAMALEAFTPMVYTPVVLAFLVVVARSAERSALSRQRANIGARATRQQG